MKTLFSVLALLFVCSVAQAQAAPSADLAINYTLSTKATDGSTLPATGPDSIGKVQFWLSLTPITAPVTGAPTVEAAPGTSNTVNFAASVGQTVYVTIKQCNVSLTCSVQANPVQVVITGKTPGQPTINTITVTLK